MANDSGSGGIGILGVIVGALIVAAIGNFVLVNGNMGGKETVNIDLPDVKVEKNANP